MISYKITRPKPHNPGLFERIGIRRQQQKEGFDLKPPINLHNQPMTVPYDPITQSKLPDGTIVDVKPSGQPAWLAMGKHQYADWLNKNVYPTFPKKTLVTLRSEPYIPGNVPRMVWVVAEIQEIHYMAQMDREANEPKCVGIKTMQFDIPMWYPPCKLRALQPEEIQAFDLLRNQTGQSATESSSVVVDEDEERFNRSSG